MGNSNSTNDNQTKLQTTRQGSLDDLIVIPQIKQQNAVRPKKINHQNVGNMTSDQVNAQTRAILMNKYSKLDETNTNDGIEYSAPKQNEGNAEWIKEITNAVKQDEKLQINLKYLSNNLGPLAMITYVRLYKYFQVILTGSTQSDHKVFIEADEQMAFNNQFIKGGAIPINSDRFLQFLVERMINIISFNKNKGGIHYAQKVVNGQAIVYVDKLIKDMVFPKVEEIAECVNRKQMKANELVLYAMMIKFYQQLGTNKTELQKIAKLSQEFYKKLNSNETKEVEKKLQELNVVWKCKATSILNLQGFRNNVYEAPKMKKFSFDENEPKLTKEAPKSLAQIIKQLSIQIEQFEEIFILKKVSTDVKITHVKKINSKNLMKLGNSLVEQLSSSLRIKNL